MPRADILKSVHCIVQEYSQLTGHSALAVDLLSKSGHPGQPRGKTKSALKRVWIQDLPSIVELSFSTGVFTAAGKCRLQVEGTCIGNQISPILSGLPVLLAERHFLSSLPAALSSSLLFLRYVDNRLILGPKTSLQSPQMQRFCDSHFYQGSRWKQYRTISGSGLPLMPLLRQQLLICQKNPGNSVLRPALGLGNWRHLAIFPVHL